MLRIGLIFGVVVSAVIMLLLWGQYGMVMHTFSTEVFVLIIGGIFLALGIFLGLKTRTKPAQMDPPPAETHEIGTVSVPDFGLSPREAEVLACLAEGLTNPQIAEKLFVSQNTIKTHTANLYVKLDVPNRTAAVAKAKALGLVK